MKNNTFDIVKLMDKLDIGILEVDLHMNYLYHNYFIESQFNLKNPTLKKILDIIEISQDIDNTITQMFTEIGITECECKINLNWIKINKIVIDNKIVFIFKNINETKKLEYELVNEKKTSEQAYNHKSLFLANVSHEIRTPLNGIVGMITLLEDTQLTIEQKDFIEMLKECCINLMSIINDILDFSKLEAGKIKLEVKCDNIRKCIESTNDILLSKLYEKNLEYTYDIDSNIPEYIKFDSSRLKQVLLNLLSNAIKFTENNGYINLNITHTNDNENIKFSIKDSGCGIDKKDQEKLFKSFSQIQNTTKINEGTGLGLSISKKLVELMGGDIWIEESILNEGSTFSFLIKSEFCKNVNEYKFNKNNIFILDDIIHNRIQLSKLVKDWGMIPHTFSCPKEALFMLKQQDYNYDLGFIDIRMPEMSGQDFSIKLKEDLLHYNKTKNKKKEIPLIALSSLGELKNYQKYFDAYLIKPPKETKLKELSKELISNNIKNYQDDYIELDIDLDLDIKNATRILLVEDVPINQKVVISFLKKIGFINVDVVDNGKSCLHILGSKRYDLILLDLRMPIMNGEEVFKYILDYYNNKNKSFYLLNKDKPYIIAVTAYSLKEDKNKYLEMGFDDYIPKPINITHLQKCMEKFILHYFN